MGLVQTTGFLTGASGSVFTIRNHGATLQVTATSADVTLARETVNAQGVGTGTYIDLDSVASGTARQAANLDAGKYKLTSAGTFYYSVTA
jgi:hypothetical protein